MAAEGGGRGHFAVIDHPCHHVAPGEMEMAAIHFQRAAIAFLVITVGVIAFMVMADPAYPVDQRSPGDLAEQVHLQPAWLDHMPEATEAAAIDGDLLGLLRGRGLYLLAAQPVCIYRPPHRAVWRRRASQTSGRSASTY